MGNSATKKITSELKKKRLRQNFLALQGYWTRKAKKKGVRTEQALRKYLARR